MGDGITMLILANPGTVAKEKETGTETKEERLLRPPRPVGKALLTQEVTPSPTRSTITQFCVGEIC